MSKRMRPIDGVQRRVVWRLYPDARQEAQLREQAAMCADLWNALLEMTERRYRAAVTRQGKAVVYHCADCAAASDGSRMRLCARHKLPSEFDYGNWISDPHRRAGAPEGHLLRDCPEWRALSTWTPRRIAASLAAAYAAFFRRLKGGDPEPGYPLFKARRRDWTIPHRSASGCRIWHSSAAWRSSRHPNNWSVALKGIDGLVRARREAYGEVTEWMDVDIIHRDGHWEASVAVSMRPWRRGGSAATIVRLDLVDGLATVNGVMQTPAELLECQALQERYEEECSEHDQRFPRGAIVTAEQACERDRSREHLARLAARIARKRRNALNGWSAAILRRAKTLKILAPPIKQSSASARGTKRQHGAYAVDAATEINRVALGYAPAAAIAMLAYKAAEANIPVEIIDDPESPYLERLAILAAGARERSNGATNAGSARNRKRRQIKGGGFVEHEVPSAILRP